MVSMAFLFSHSFFKKKKIIYLYLKDNYNIVLVSAIHQPESVIGIHMAPPSHLLAHPTHLSSGFPVHHHLLELGLTSIELVMLSNHLILSHPLLLPSIFPSSRAFSN